MNYGNAYEKDWDSCENIFDLAVCCYDKIMLHVGNEQNFIAQYMDHPKKNGKKNPNLEKLDEITNEILGKFRAEPEEYCFVKHQKYIWERLENCFLQPFEEERVNQVTPLMAVLRGIDQFVYQSRIDGERRWKAKGPLNMVKKDGSAIYFKSIPSLLDESKESLKFRKVSQSSDIGSTLSSLRIINPLQLAKNASFPRVVYVPFNSKRSEGIKGMLEKHALRILILPYIPVETFKVVETYGSAFAIQYIEKPNPGIDYVRYMMGFAVEKNANFVLIPEFVAEEPVLKVIHEYLEDNQDSIRRSSLIAIFAGSTYENYNNVMHILHYTGREIGTYYKYSPFTEEDVDRNNTFHMCEYLESPGKECTLLDIEDVGRILPAICRDIIDGDYTEKLVKILLPMLVAAPTYSTSVASFEHPLQYYAKAYHTSTVLCNHCLATIEKKDNSIVTIAAMPQKKGNKMEGYLCPAMRQKDCRNQCGGNGCGYLVDMKYGRNFGVDGNIGPTIRIEQHFVGSSRLVLDRKQ